MDCVHYWRRAWVIDSTAFAGIVTDARLLLKALRSLGLCLAGRYGWGAPVVGADEICFNGPSRCPRAAPGPSGVPGAPRDGTGCVAGSAPRPPWTDDGPPDCAYDTFTLPRTVEIPDPPTRLRDHVWQRCETAGRPYDLAVRGVLVVARHHLGGGFVVDVAGRPHAWDEARQACQAALGYGRDLPLG